MSAIAHAFKSPVRVHLRVRACACVRVRVRVRACVRAHTPARDEPLAVGAECDAPHRRRVAAQRCCAAPVVAILRGGTRQKSLMEVRAPKKAGRVEGDGSRGGEGGSGVASRMRDGLRAGIGELVGLASRCHARVTK
eukprot:2151249-Pleurochrysis_carterae.AAC.2